ncbi:hypothetical protein FHW16_000137 [Phyllobacterium myrsinacearum]|uniref:Uncharacterized protein n=1 Tax=Phyllobacterium myrsinacearum TaxID=28101 RepID=A0A839EDQ4_9HYPH|nr:hypothetical protein [Phyllobacterium myrsinacearum]
MNITFFRLEPSADFTGHAIWERSKIRETCWVRASNEQDARLIASIKLRTAAPSGDDGSNSPWLNGLLVQCNQDVPPLDFGNRSLITVSGKIYL